MAAPTRARSAAALAAAALAAGVLGVAVPPASSTPATPPGTDAPSARPSTDPAAGPSTDPAAGPSGYPDRPVSRLVVRMKDRLPLDRRVAAAVAAAVGVDHAAQVRRTVDGAVVVALSRPVPAAKAEQAARAIAARADVAWAQPDRWMYVDSDPVPRYDAKPQWNLWDTASATGGYGVRPASAWLGSRGSRSVVVAVVDTGITAHPDLAGHLVPGYDFVSADDLPPGSGLNATPLTANDGDGRDADPSDPGDWISAAESSSFNFFKGCPTKRSSWHGTHVTGIVVAQKNGTGVVGVAPDVVVQPVRAVGKCSGSESDIADAVVWAAGGSVEGVRANATPASVINLSLGGPGRCGALMKSAITRALALGATVVAATGNGGGSVAYQSASDPGSFPANCPGVVSVAASSRSGRLGVDGSGAPYANTGDKLGQVTLSAPGGSQTGSPDDGIWSTVNAGATRPTKPTYASYVGTSMAAPHVSAAAALLQSARLDSRLAPSTMKATLARLVRPFADGSSCAKLASRPCGSGILDLSRLSPQQVVAEPRDGEVALSWLSPADLGRTVVSGYVVDRYAAGSSTPVRVATADAGATSAVDATAVNGTAYRYLVRARIGSTATVGALRTAPVVPTATPEPGMPTSVAATPAVAGVDLTWSAPVVGAASVTGYVVQYRSSRTSTWSCALPLVAGQCPPVAGGAATAAYSLDLSALPSITGDYDVRVTAGTETGLGTPSRPQRVRVPGLVRTAALSGTTLRPFVDRYQDTVVVTASTTLESTAEVRITPAAGGAPVRTYVLPPARSFRQTWNGLDGAGRKVAPGRYVVTVVTDDLDGISAIPTSQRLVVTVASSDVGTPVLRSSSPTVYWRSDGFLDTVTFTATTPVPATAVFTVRSIGGNVLWRKTSGTASLAPQVTWSGRRSANGTPLPDGTYRLDVTVTGTNGTKGQVLGRSIAVSSKVLTPVRFTRTVTPSQVVISALRGGVALTPYTYDGLPATELRVRGGLASPGSVYDVLALGAALPPTVAARGYSGVKVATCLRRSPVGTSILATGWMDSPSTFTGWFAALVDESTGSVAVQEGTIDCRTPNLTMPASVTAGGRVRWTLFNWGAARTDYVPVYRFTITGTRYTLS